MKKIILSLSLVLSLGVLVSCSCGDSAGPTEPPTDTNQPPIITNQIFSVSDSIKDTNVIGVVLAVDPEGEALTYRILTNSDVKFEINKTNGSLSLSNGQSLGFSTSTNHRLVVSVSDGELSSDATMTIYVTNDRLVFYDITTISAYQVFTNVRQYSNLTTFTPTLISNFETVDFVDGVSNTNLFTGVIETFTIDIISNFFNTATITNVNPIITVMSNANGLLSNVMLSTISFVTNANVSNNIVSQVFSTNDSVTNLSNNIQNTDNLSNVDLSSFILSNLDFSNYILIGANLTNANLSNANLIGANLSNANFIAFENKFGSEGSGDGQFQDPQGIAVDDNFIYVVDSTRDDVQIFNKSNQEYVTEFGRNGNSNGQFVSPQDIAVDDGFIYVVDSGRDNVQIFNKSDQAFVTKFGSNGTNNGEFKDPRGIAVDDGFIYVLDSDRERNDVQVFNKSDQIYITNFGTNNRENKTPRDIAVDDDFIYIADNINRRSAAEVVLFEKNNYSFFTNFGDAADINNGVFREPSSIAVDDNFIYVTDVDRLNLQIFNKSDRSYITKVVSTADNSPFPQHVVVDNGFIYILYVINRVGVNDVQIFSSSLRGAILE